MNRNKKTLTSFFSHWIIPTSKDDKHENFNTLVSELSESKATENCALSVLKVNEYVYNAGTRVFDDSFQSLQNSSLCCKEINLWSQWRSVWTEEMWNYKRDTFPWIDCNECKTCSNDSYLGEFRKEWIAISREWHSYILWVIQAHTVHVSSKKDFRA